MVQVVQMVQMVQVVQVVQLWQRNQVVSKLRLNYVLVLRNVSCWGWGATNP